MKKFFLIPLMTLVCSVMAFAGSIDCTAFPMPNPDGSVIEASAPAKARKVLMDNEEPANEAKIGSVEYATLQEAIDAAEENAIIDLMTDAVSKVNGFACIIYKNVTIKGNGHSINGIVCLLEYSYAPVVTFDGVTIAEASWALYVNGHATINLAGTNSWNTTYGVYGYNKNDELTFQGDGELTSNITFIFYLMGHLYLNAPNVSLSTNMAFSSYGVNAITITAGQYSFNPAPYTDLSSYLITKPSSLYRVSAPTSNDCAYNQAKYAVYSNLQEAVTNADEGDCLVMFKSDNTAIEVSKNLVIDNGEFSLNVSAGASYTKVGSQGHTVITNNALVAYLQGDETAQHVVSASTDISTMGQIIVKGTKSISIADEVVVTCKKQLAGASIIVPNGASLTIEGDGTIASDEDLILVEKGGVLTIGKADKLDQPKFSTSVNARVNHILKNNGNATINNAKMTAKSAAIHNNGVLTVLGGLYTGEASTATKHKYCITTDSGSKMTLKNATVKGVHGAVACQAISGNESSATIDNCTLIATDSPNGVKVSGGVHYGLYVATLSVVSVYNTKMYSTAQAYSTYIGDNDVYTKFGLIYLYDGCLLKQKMHVQQTKDRDDDLVFPVSISKDSEWYKVASKKGGGFGPLPANCVYKAIIAEGEPTDEQVLDAAAYAEGYRWKVVSTATKTAEVDENATTIPWQQSSTWDATKASTSTTEVPTAATVVTVPEGKTVVISADPAKNNGVTDAKAEQIFLAEGASLTVETGTTLKVGEGGVNIANGGQLVVEPGAIVTVGATGLVTTEEEALVIEATEEDQGVFLLQPEVTENTQPKATIKLVTKCKQVGANEFVWERFAIPTLDGNATIFNAERLDTVTIYGGGSFEQGLYEWSDASQDWAPVSNWHNLQPFKGYQLTNNSKYGNVTYTFEGNLAGNVGQNFEFAQAGFGFFGNSYTGDIDIQKFMESFGENMQKTIWIYDYYTDQFKAVTEASYGSVYYGKRNNRHGAITDIRSMQAFLMNTFAEGASSTQVNYANAIWGNPKYGLVPTPTPAPAKRVAANEDKFTVYVAGAKQEDEVTFIRSNAYSAAFDNGVDASKWMNNGLNLYVATEDGELASVASDEIVDMTIAFQSGNETEYTLGFDNLRGEQFELRDVLTGATIQMTEGATYTFSQEANTTVPARFQIIGARKVATGVENVNEGAAVQQKVIENGVLYILRGNKWYNAQGQIVK